MENNINIKESASIDNMLAVNVNYKDLSVLTNESEELSKINYYFDSVTCSNKEIETLLYEIIGSCLCRDIKLNKAFIFKGKGRNGKSVIFRILEALLGTKQCSHEHLEQLSGCKAGGKSTIRALSGCVVNIAEDQKQPKYINTSLITRIISREPISLGLKGNKREELVPKVTMLFSVNEVIDFKETGIYITDRFVVIPFNATFTDNNNNKIINIGKELCKPLALQIITTRAVQAFKKVLENGRFTIPAVVEEETRNYFMECNNVSEFCNLYPIREIITKSKYYDEYCEWCKYNNKEAVSNSIFGKEVLTLEYRAERYSFGNKRETYYASLDFNNSDSRNLYEEYLKIKDTNNTISSFSNYLWKRLDNKANEIENA